MTTIINGPDDLKARVGQHLGYSDWLEITQERVNQFADATGDHQWIHVDVERAKEGPFGGPIAHGFLTLSLAPGLLKDVWAVQGASDSVRNPWAIGPPKGPAFARSTLTWIHWWSPVASANWLTRSWVISSQSL